MYKSIIFLTILFSSLYADTTWESSSPKADEYDWIQLTSGEWLKGEIKGLYDEKLEFDSDKLDLLTIDWEDIKQIKSSSDTSLNIEERGIIVGKLKLYEEYIVVENSDGNISVDKSKIISMTNGNDHELNYWSGKLSFGVTLSSGNTDQIEYTAKFNTKRQTADTRFIIDYIGNYSETNNAKTEDNQRLNSSIDIFQTRNFFWRPAFVEYYKDSFQNIDSKLTYGLGLGYDFIANPRTDLTLFTGPALQTTKFDNVEEGESDTEETATFIFVTDYNTKLTNNLDFIVKYQAYIVSQASGTYTHHFISTLETELINNFDLDVTFIWDRVQDPTANADGIVPEKDDYKTILSVGYSY